MSSTPIRGTNVAAPLAPYTQEDTYPTHDAIYGKGGLRSVALASERDSIPVERRVDGMVVYVVSAATFYRLKSDLFTWETLSEHLLATRATGVSLIDSVTQKTHRLTLANGVLTVGAALD